MAENSTCQNCSREFYRADPERSGEDLDERIAVSDPKAISIIKSQAQHYCEDCLEKLFPGMIVSRLHQRAEGECGGGRWVNPKRGVTRS